MGTVRYLSMRAIHGRLDSSLCCCEVVPFLRCACAEGPDDVPDRHRRNGKDDLWRSAFRHPRLPLSLFYNQTVSVPLTSMASLRVKRMHIAPGWRK